MIEQARLLCSRISSNPGLYLFILGTTLLLGGCKTLAERRDECEQAGNYWYQSQHEMASCRCTKEMSEVFGCTRDATVIPVKHNICPPMFSGSCVVSSKTMKVKQKKREGVPWLHE